MAGRILLFITIFLFISFKSFSAVFVVTSNADSGPGTLREALTLAAANGIAEKDYINFNLPDLSEAGRTIKVQTSLPLLSSNLVIDGSTQPGNKIGISDTKITIKMTDNLYPDYIVIFNGQSINNIEIDGIFFDFIAGRGGNSNTISIINSSKYNYRKSWQRKYLWVCRYGRLHFRRQPCHHVS
ncbi:hypothetical protein MTO98_05320 [Mucilaginibacter sp. SMC90]|uniref:hypothetical protein n=1 Tax=Mucilaginibacter sp. SMC90 TaxID=2929803 RepID=UPI001FB4DAE8|nr:hypothetical protein [Mucilaginibacter sp. SMC90]UOE50493.1 hypothetical protein MTO98_05320 [Mucilaginibacter sp. SMC90]